MTRDKLILVVDNESGVLAKIASLFTSKNCNIESIISECTENPALTKLTIEVSGSDSQVPKLYALLAKMIPVHSVERKN